MSLIESITSFIHSIFNKSSPEGQKKAALKKLDQEIREYYPLICKNGMLQPNFGEAVFILYKNVRPLDNLFISTIGTNDIPRQHRFEAQLIITAYNSDFQEVIESLSFENKKAEVLDDYKNADRVYARQKKKIENVIRELNTDTFKEMDNDIKDLRMFVDFCHLNFVPFLQLFDYNFEPANMAYKPNYNEVEVEKCINLLEDLYFQISNLKITSNLAEAVVAVAQLKKGDSFTDTDRSLIIDNFKKINYVLNHVISPEKIKTLLRYARQDENYEPKKQVLNASPIKEFADLVRTRFEVDEKRIKTEIQDEKISADVAQLFPEKTLQEVGAYNQENGAMLQADTPLTFQWILPMKILKTFLLEYITPNVKNLLNDLVIEGFFNNPTYKTNFSTMVYGAINADKEIQIFEDSFGNDQKNSISVLGSYIKDSKKDKDFYKKLEMMVSRINNDAYTLLQTEVTTLVTLYHELGELIEDAKKPSSEIISNLKVLMMSSRNRDSTNILESQYANWEIFFEIMRNYVIINTGERV